MATITGTSGNDVLTGTAGNDLLISAGGQDLMSGGAGADTYQINRYGLAPSVVINDQGTDGAIDVITGGAGLYQSASFGFSAWATAERVGHDLFMTLPGRPYRFHKPAYSAVDIQIKDHYAGGAVEQIVLGSTTYNLASGNLGTASADIVAGTAGNDVLYGYDGNDYITANGGKDKVFAGAGIDIVFGGEGRNVLNLGTGDDRAYGGSGRDVVIAGDGNDLVYAGEGDNKVIAGNGNDYVITGAGNDVIKGGNGNDALKAGDGDNQVFGGAGTDVIEVGAGNSRLSGGKDGDDYIISVAAPASITISDDGKAPASSIFATATFDDVIFKAYGYDMATLHNLDVQVSGNDLILSYAQPGAAGGSIDVTVLGQFSGARNAIERVGFGNTDASARFFNVAHLSGDNRTYSVHYGVDAGADDLVLGTTGDDVLYGGFGTNIIVGGGGADRFMYHDEGDNRGGLDIIRDFDLANDVLDFTEIKTLDQSGLTIADNSYGNAVISSVYQSIELVGISASQFDVNHPMFVFGNTPTPTPVPTPTPTPTPTPKPTPTPTPTPVPTPTPTPVPTPTPIPVPGATVHTGTAAVDTLKGGDGVDQFVFTPDTAFMAVDNIKNFILADGDLLDVSALLTGYDPNTNALSEFVTVTQDPQESFATLAVDRDGLATVYSSTDIATIQDFNNLTLAILEANGLIIA